MIIRSLLIMTKHSSTNQPSALSDLNLFQDLINHSSEMVFIFNINTNLIEFANQTALETLGYTLQELNDIGIDAYRKPIANETFKEHLEKLKQETSLVDHAILICKDKTELYIEANVRIVHRDGIDYNIVMIRDISEHMDLIKNLHYEKDLAQEYLDIVKVLIMALDSDYNVLMINQKGADILGYSKEEIIGKNWMENFLPKSMIKKVEKVGQDIIKEEENNYHKTYENPILTKSGQERMIRWSNSPLKDANGKTIGVLTSGEDITEVRDQERQLLMHTRQAQMGEMISMIAHQWRQPLTSISAVTTQIKFDIALDKLNHDTLLEKADKIEKQILHLSDTITDFQNYFKPDKDKERITLKELFEKLRHLIDPTLLSNEIEMSYLVETPVSIETHVNEVLQVLLTLVKNSQEVFSERSVVNAKISIDTEDQGDNVAIFYHDNGGGIREEIIDEIFMPYFSTKKAKQGTGLGLYMAKTVIEEHCNGEVYVNNEDGGILFTILLPKKFS